MMDAFGKLNPSASERSQYFFELWMKRKEFEFFAKVFNQLLSSESLRLSLIFMTDSSSTVTIFSEFTLDSEPPSRDA